MENLLAPKSEQLRAQIRMLPKKAS